MLNAMASSEQLMDEPWTGECALKRYTCLQVAKQRSASIQGTTINQNEIKAFKANKAGNIFE